ncbi:hypothetical protein H2199_008915 [Coniosporium tulheliwenetii]|uniref:Uncharacterized protein n=1 Tax=Coniosporium tulheliwenetii TaxID=3383036 RepID=A0ACC2YHG9_9PEZI|nr:hypothetical protein H2199_008915 [Cladosporium sp. JES 115]
MSLAVQNHHAFLLEDAVRATTPARRRAEMVLYYQRMLADKRRSPLLEDLRNLSAGIAALSTSRQNMLANTANAIVPQTSRLLSLPAETLDRIFEFIFANPLLEVRHLKDVSGLLVCRGLLEFGLQHLLSQEIVYHSSEMDGRCEMTGTYIWWPQAAAPFYGNVTYKYISSPNLSTLPPSSYLTDPLTYIKNVRIDLELPPIVHELGPSTYQAAPGTSYRNLKLTHPHLPSDAGLDMRVPWFQADTLLEKAEYHLGVLRDLPFKNLHTLRLGFGNLRARNAPDCAWLWVICIAKYLRSIRIDRKAEKIVFEDEDRDVVRVITVLVDTGSLYGATAINAYMA